MKKLKNSCGTFWVNADGVLESYTASPLNIHKKTDTVPQNLKKLILPEGITELPAHAFQFFDIQTELRLPDSLRVLQDLALDLCSAPDIVFPEHLEYIGFGVLLRARIRSVRLPRNLHMEYRNMLRHAQVGKLFLPEAYMENLRPELTARLAVEKMPDGYWAFASPEGYLSGDTVRSILSQSLKWDEAITELLRTVADTLCTQIQEKIPEAGSCPEIGVTFRYPDNACIGRLSVYGFQGNDRSIVAGACQRGNDRMVSNLLQRGTKQHCLDWLRSPEAIGELRKAYDHLQHAAEMAD